MKYFTNNFHLIGLLVAVQFAATGAFIKLIPFGKKIEFISKTNTVHVSYALHQPKSILNQSIDLEFNITHPLKDVKLQFSYHLTDENGAIQALLIKRTVDLCAYMRNPSTDRVVKQVYDYVTERTNVKLQCPIAAGNYYIRNIRPSDVPTPGFLPEAHLVLETLYRSEVRRATLIEFRCFIKMVRYIENIF
uniref:MD-2-related lipid-recognition domain-containing protein n=1 Tax=Anopheles melas TaxID=34690 RepID=A0A2C9H4W2_9DIPT